VRTFLFITLLLPSFVALAQPGETDSVERDYSAELPRIAATEPGDALATFQVHEGFQLELAASEPLVNDPVAMAFDEKGRMFVCEMTGYSEKRTEELGDVRLLEDTDNDGVYDKSTVPTPRTSPGPLRLSATTAASSSVRRPTFSTSRTPTGDDVADTRRGRLHGFQAKQRARHVEQFQLGPRPPDPRFV
jgi:hypothetical protein